MLGALFNKLFTWVYPSDCCFGPPLSVILCGMERQKGNPALYDLVVRGGKVIDPSQELEAVRDIAIASGKIACIEREIPIERARRVIAAKDMIVTPGLIDIHTHVFPFTGPYGIEADSHCVCKGVTTVVDAGTSGALTFPAFRRFEIERSATRIRALLHVAAIGMVAGSTPGMGELEDLRYSAPELAVEQARANPDVIVGFKIRLSSQYTGANDLEGMARARQAADEAGLPLMIHIGGSHSPLRRFLSSMKKGDIVTHCFNGRSESLLDENGKIRAEVWEARERGVGFDVGHGAGSFSFDVAGRCLEQGFLPDTISTDLYSANVEGPVFDLPATLSKFLLLGLTLPEVIRRATVNAAAAFDFGAKIGSLEPGSEADVGVFEVCDGSFAFTDTDGKIRQGRQKLRPVVTLREGREFFPPA